MVTQRKDEEHLNISSKIAVAPFTELEVLALLGKVHIPTETFMNILSVNSVGSERYQMIVETFDIQWGKRAKIIIDISLFAPTWQQFIDVTYDQGSTCDFKIIIFNEDDDSQVPSSDAYLIADLVRINNKCAVPTYFLNGNGNLLRLSSRIMDLEIIEPTGYTVTGPCMVLPSKRLVQEAEFWIPYYWGTMNPESLAYGIEDLSGTSSYGLGKNLDSLVNWNDEGLFMEVFSEADDQEINWLWNHKKKDIEDQYPGSALQLISKQNGLKSLSIRVDNTPITHCLAGSAWEKEGFVGLVYENELKFVDLMENLLREGRKERMNFQ